MEQKVEAFRKRFTKLYNQELATYTEEIRQLDKAYAKKNPYLPSIVRPEFDVDTVMRIELEKWEKLLEDYKKETGKTYRKPPVINVERENALESNKRDKEKALELREAKRMAQFYEIPKGKKKPKSTGPPLKEVEVIEPVTETILVKVKPKPPSKNLFAQMKYLAKNKKEYVEKPQHMNPWITFLRQYSFEKSVPYNRAMQDPNVKRIYKEEMEEHRKRFCRDYPQYC